MNELYLVLSVGLNVLLASALIRFFIVKPKDLSDDLKKLEKDKLKLEKDLQNARNAFDSYKLSRNHYMLDTDEVLDVDAALDLMAKMLESEGWYGEGGSITALAIATHGSIEKVLAFATYLENQKTDEVALWSTGKLVPPKKLQKLLEGRE